MSEIVLHFTLGAVYMLIGVMIGSHIAYTASAKKPPISMPDLKKMASKAESELPKKIKDARFH